MFDLAAHAPDPWTGPAEYQPNSAMVLDGDFLSEDFCILQGEHFFVRGVVEIPVFGIANSLGLGCWTTLSRENFDRYVDGFDTGYYGNVGPWSGWLSNRILPFMERESNFLPSHVRPRAGRMRPLIDVAIDGHPLAAAQEEGISPEEVLAVYAIHGHSPAAPAR